jgi:hypothetical protein
MEPITKDGQYILSTNARLLAAAPELLTSLKGLFEHCAMVHKHWGTNCNAKEAAQAIARAEAAIAKAEGR